MLHLGASKRRCASAGLAAAPAGFAAAKEPQTLCYRPNTVCLAPQARWPASQGPELKCSLMAMSWQFAN